MRRSRYATRSERDMAYGMIGRLVRNVSSPSDTSDVALIAERLWRRKAAEDVAGSLGGFVRQDSIATEWYRISVVAILSQLVQRPLPKIMECAMDYLENGC